MKVPPWTAADAGVIMTTMGAVIQELIDALFGCPHGCTLTYVFDVPALAYRFSVKNELGKIRLQREYGSDVMAKKRALAEAVRQMSYLDGSLHFAERGLTAMP